MASRRVLTISDAHLPEVAARGVRVPQYDRERLAPRIVHVGVGGFHRSHLAAYADELAAGGSDWGITGLGMLDHDAAMASALHAQDHLYTLLAKGAGRPDAAVIGSIVGFVHAPPGHDQRVAELVAAPDTAIVSLTVTEGGYAEPAAGTNPTFDRLARGLALRRERGGGPLTVLSCDNLPGNGDAAREALLAAADRLDPALAGWSGTQCTFPNSMVDRITPQTAAADRAWLLEELGLDDRWPVVAEPFRQWVLEDDFAAGRPSFEAAGAVFSDRIHAWELYKLRLLNAGHSCLAYLSALAGIAFVHEALADPTVRRFLEALLRQEVIPTLDAIPGHPPEAYAATVVERFANPGVRDQIARICADGSAKFPAFLVPTIERGLETGGPVGRAATALAGWAHYLAEPGEAGVAPDPHATEAGRHARAALADPTAFLDFRAVFTPMLRDSPRFRDAFAEAHRRIGAHGPFAAMSAGGEPETTAAPS